MTRTTKECRNGNHCEPETFGKAIYCLILHSRLSVAEIGARTGKSEGYLRKAANADYEDLHLQADTLLAVTLATGNLVALRFMATQASQALVSLPQGDVDAKDILVAFAAAIEEAGKDGGAIQRALQNDRIDAGERNDVCAEIDRTITAFMAVKQLVCAKAAKGGAR